MAMNGHGNVRFLCLLMFVLVTQIEQEATELTKEDFKAPKPSLQP